jgi:hypothetical protein
MPKLTNKLRNKYAARAIAMWLDSKLNDEDYSERPTVGEASEWIEGILSTRGGTFRKTRPKGAGAEALWVAWQFESGRHHTITGLMMLYGDAAKLRAKACVLAAAMWKHRSEIAGAARNAIAEIAVEEYRDAS